MDALHRACMVVAGVCLVVITLIIPYGVFTRYVLNSASSWPEPLAVLLMIVLSFLSAVVCYRENLHIGVGVLPALLGERGKAVLGWLIELCMMAHQPVHALVRHQARARRPGTRRIAEFPLVSVGVSYLPMPIGGAHHRAVRHRAPAGRGEFFREHDDRDHQHSLDRIAPSGADAMDILILLGGFTVAVPARHAGRLRARPRRDPRRALDRPAARSRHAQDLRRHGRLSRCWRSRSSSWPARIMAEGGMAERHRQPRQGVRRLHPRRPGAGQHPRLDHVRLHLGLVGRRHRLDRLGDDPADDQGRLSAPVRRQRHDLGLAAAAADPALAQRGDLFARRRRHDLGRAPVHGRRHPGPAARAVADGPVPDHRPPAQLPEGRGRFRCARR